MTPVRLCDFLFLACENWGKALRWCMNAGGGFFLLLHQLNKKMAFQSIFLGTFWFDSNLLLVGIDKVHCSTLTRSEH